MASVRILNVSVLQNPGRFLDSIVLEIEFESVADLKSDLEFSVVYVGSPENNQFDQVLEEIEVGPIPKGVMKFQLECPPPDVTKIPANELLDVTAVLVSCKFQSNEFARIGYYVNNTYDEAHAEWNLTPPDVPQVEFIIRNILSDKPRHTVFKINWSEEEDSHSTEIAGGSASNIVSTTSN
eukprot:ANDGO_00935.mRNA.1 Histone chaperone asf1